MAISSITLAELVHGAEKSSDPARNLAVIEDFASRLSTLSYGEKAAYHYGSIRSALEKRASRSESMICTSPPMLAVKALPW